MSSTSRRTSRLFAMVLVAVLVLPACRNASDADAEASGPSQVPESAQSDPFDWEREQRNFSKVFERQAEYSTPEYSAALAQASAENEAEALRILATDPERNFLFGLCHSYGYACAGDVRLYHWQARGFGLVEPVLFTARNGATISGHVWRTAAGPEKRPAIVVTPGSAQATEPMYWWGVQALAKAGYVVLSFDVQGQGFSDTRGEPPDENEGFPAQSTGTPFFDGTEDALDFLLSTPAQPYCPRPSRSSGTDHCPKQTRRAASKLNATFNPYWEWIDASRVGLAGHSYGAQGVTFVGQRDPRVDAVVAWDNLCLPGEAPDRVPIVDSLGGAQASQYCQVGFSLPLPALSKPSLGISADYFVAQPRREAPDPLERSFASREYSRQGLDTGEIVIRGGTHFDFSYLPAHPFTASLRGIDIATWYTVAWFDKYLKDDPTADERLLTTRWRNDRLGAAIDPEGDPNLYSFYFRSRLDLELRSGRRWVCEDLRSGCAGQRLDAEPADFRFLDVVNRID